MRLIARAVAVVAGVLLAALVAGAVTNTHTSAATAAPAASAVNLATAANFSVLAGTTVTSIPPTSMNAELGLSPGSSVTGAPSASATHIDDAVAVTAKTDLTAAYNEAAAAGPTTAVIPDAGNIGGETLVPGVYSSASSIFLTGKVTLNAEGNPDATFIFQAGSTVITASKADVALVGGAQACNVYWQVGSSATLGTSTTFAGTVMALTSITSTTGVTVDGRLLARNGAVTLDDTTINTRPCASTPTSTSTTTSTGSWTSTSSASTGTRTVTSTNTGPCGCASTTTSPTVTGSSPPPATTTLTSTSTGPCGCVLRAPVKWLPPKKLGTVTVKPGRTVTVRLPVPGCGCVVVPGATPPEVVKYVVVVVPGHCHVTIDQKTATLKFRADKGRHGKFIVKLKRGKQKVTCHFLVKARR